MAVDNNDTEGQQNGWAATVLREAQQSNKEDESKKII